MALDHIHRVRRLALLALVSDDEFMELFVVKGGNALELLQDAPVRASADIDISLPGDFPEPDIEALRTRFESLLRQTLGDNDYHVFDVRFERRPEHLTADFEEFWGGYLLEFKVVSKEVFEKFGGDLESIRKRAVIGLDGKARLRVEFSRHEECSSKEELDVEGYTVYVYSPIAMVCEKLRAICQQMPVYREQLKSHPGTARARDFFDIHFLCERFGLALDSDEARELIPRVFAAKRVPLELIGEIGEQRDFHREGFDSVKDTVLAPEDLRSFDFYFDYVLDVVRGLKTGRME